MSDNPLVKAVQHTLVSREDLNLLLEQFFSGKSVKTMMTYREAFHHFREFIGVETDNEVVAMLVNEGHLKANLLVTKYKQALIEQKYASNSINVRLSAIRSFVSLANSLGAIPWSLAVRGVKVIQYKDTRGPGSEDVEKLIAAAENQPNKRAAARDVAIIKLMFFCGFRKNEVRMIDTTDINFKDSSVAILRKGFTEKVIKTLPDDCAATLKQWIALRNGEPGAVFVSLQYAKRLSEKGIWKIVTELSRLHANIGHVYPHKLRHSAINEAFEQDPDIRAVQQFSGHKSLETLTIYDDHRKDKAGDIAQKIADKFKKK